MVTTLGNWGVILWGDWWSKNVVRIAQWRDRVRGVSSFSSLAPVPSWSGVAHGVWSPSQDRACVRMLGRFLQMRWGELDSSISRTTWKELSFYSLDAWFYHSSPCVLFSMLCGWSCPVKALIRWGAAGALGIRWWTRHSPCLHGLLRSFWFFLSHAWGEAPLESFLNRRITWYGFCIRSRPGSSLTVFWLSNSDWQATPKLDLKQQQSSVISHSFFGSGT